MPFSKVPKLGIIPERRKGARLNLRTLYRWATVGLRGVKLPSLLVGSQRVTSVEALVRFFAAVSESSIASFPTATPNVRQKESTEAVEAELDRAGI